MELPTLNDPLTRIKVHPKRKCGACTMCCTNMEIQSPELNKPAGTPCQHLCEKGCSIHDKQPAPCHDFYCLWRLGFFTESDRPDKIGTLFTLNTSTKIWPVLAIAEGKVDSSRAVALIDELAHHSVVIVKTDKVRTIKCPTAEYAQVIAMNMKDILRKE